MSGAKTALPAAVDLAFPLGALPAGVAIDLIVKAMLSATKLAAAEPPESMAPMSLNQVAKFSKRRTALAVEALRTGALKGVRRGKSWAIERSAARSWIAAGCPERP